MALRGIAQCGEGVEPSNRG
ncbi:unnamed protein product [Linum tenue]|uniref:Uncharacterized protein n=1 Tax=Linum tenue TaxID=586396 RepID=A0AAV0R0U1_9ROSI|nr:unnamed protein product [Linum tenue]